MVVNRKFPSERVAHALSFVIAQILLCVLPARAQVASAAEPEAPTSAVPQTTSAYPSDSSKGVELDGSQESVGDQRSFHDDWMLFLAGVTHFPLDLGIEAGVEMPFGLRVSGGYAYVPAGYLGMITGALSQAQVLEPESRTLIEKGFETGRSWRLQMGIRPFRNFGGYLDAGFSRVSFSGALDANEAADASGIFIPGAYAVNSRIDLWFVELGYQALIAERVVLALGFGAMRVTNARTQVAVDGSAASVQLFEESVTADVDNAIEKYGIIPTLSLRLGFDVI